MRHLLVLFPLIAFATTNAALAADEGIRSFPIPTLEALGRELYVRDHMVATASDALFAAFPKAHERHLKGWISQVSQNNSCVYFIGEQDSKFVLAFTATFPRSGPPKIEDQKDAPLPEDVAKRYAARRAAIAAIPKFMTETYNFEVLDDPDGPGFLVYALAATEDPTEVVVGGHYRISVSADGTKVRQVDALSHSFLVLHKPGPEVPKNNKLAGMMMSHVVSNTPVETHVYLNLLHKIPFFVVTMDRNQWDVTNGTITKTGKVPK